MQHEEMRTISPRKTMAGREGIKPLLTLTKISSDSKDMLPLRGSIFAQVDLSVDPRKIAENLNIIR